MKLSKTISSLFMIGAAIAFVFLGANSNLVQADKGDRVPSQAEMSANSFTGSTSMQKRYSPPNVTGTSLAIQQTSNSSTIKVAARTVQVQSSLLQQPTVVGSVNNATGNVTKASARTIQVQNTSQPAVLNGMNSTLPNNGGTYNTVKSQLIQSGTILNGSGNLTVD